MSRQNGWPALFWNAFKGSRNAMVLLDDRRCHVEVNGAYLKLLGYPRTRLVGRPVYELIVGGPQLTVEQWEDAIGHGDFTGEAALVCHDGSDIRVQFAAHPEVVTGQRLVLFVVLSTSRWGRHSRREINPEAAAALSPREREIVRFVALGETGPEIAEQLHISHQTVRTHIRNAMHKLGARSRAQLVAKALGDGHALQ
jgi:PAS domain S-box-containing protein